MVSRNEAMGDSWGSVGMVIGLHLKPPGNSGLMNPSQSPSGAPGTNGL